jgi:hypothetical protein
MSKPNNLDGLAGFIEETIGQVKGALGLMSIADAAIDFSPDIPDNPAENESDGAATQRKRKTIHDFDDPNNPDSSGRRRGGNHERP